MVCDQAQFSTVPCLLEPWFRVRHPHSAIYVLCDSGQLADDTPGSPEGNTEGPGTAFSEPLLPS